MTCPHDVNIIRQITGKGALRERSILHKDGCPPHTQVPPCFLKGKGQQRLARRRGVGEESLKRTKSGPNDWVQRSQSGDNGATRKQHDVSRCRAASRVGTQQRKGSRYGRMISPSISQNLECSPKSVRKSSVCEESGAGSKRLIFTRKKPTRRSKGAVPLGFSNAIFSAHKFSPTTHGPSSHCENVSLGSMFTVFSLGSMKRCHNTNHLFTWTNKKTHYQRLMFNTHEQKSHVKQQETSLPKAHCQ